MTWKTFSIATPKTLEALPARNPPISKSELTLAGLSMLKLLSE